MTREPELTLCAPDAEKSCAACCPPIRPAGYEHVQYSNIFKRMLRENTIAFGSRTNEISPITGFSCWALGYLDNRYRLVGCLLHPSRNNGVDLRYLVDYGEKCRRESCPEARVFLELEIADREFWLHLADGLDSLAYSSKRVNPLFKMLGWGSELLHLIASNEEERSFTEASFSRAYPFFSTTLDPPGHAYLLNQLLKTSSVDPLMNKWFRTRFEAFSTSLLGRLRGNASFRRPEAPYTHLAGLDLHFLNFLRLSVGIARIDLEGASSLKRITDRAVKEFQESLVSGP